MFGDRKPKPKKNEVWTAMAEHFEGASLVMDKRGRNVKEVRFPIGGRVLVLDTYTESTGQSSQTYTRVRGIYAPDRANTEFRFRAYRRSVLSGLGKMLGMQDIEVGHPDVDPDWIIKGNSVGHIQSLMVLPDVVRSLGVLRSGRLENRKFKRKGAPKGLMEVRWLKTGVLRDREKLGAAVFLVAAVLEHLERMGVAMQEPLGVEP